MNHARLLGRTGWALVGDAGYFKDPVTSHGITDALRDAELLARAVLQGTSAAYGVMSFGSMLRQTPH